MITIHDVETVANQGPFFPNWESLKGIGIPAWYSKGRYGIFIHWGVYSVPAYICEWYPRQMYIEGSPEFEHHVATYGEHTKFGYKDFIPMFKAENFNADDWVTLFKESGAQFVVPVAEHHDGFAMYNTDLSEWNAVKMGPMRDVVGELAKATVDHEMVFGLSSHRAEHCWFFDGGLKFPSDVQDPNFQGLYGPTQKGPEKLDDYASPEGPTPEFVQDWLLRCCELVDRYQPQLVWFDWWINHQNYKEALKLFAAYYYNRGKEWNKEVAINYKYDAYPEGAAILDIERGQLSGIRKDLWQNDTSIATNSWCYVDGLKHKSVDSIIDDLADLVSKNGALLLNVCPKADGTFPEEEKVMLREIGSWLQINGEAIFDVEPWKVFGEGPTEVAEGAFKDTDRTNYTPEDIRFTLGKSALYAIVLAWPETTFTISSLTLSNGLIHKAPSSVTLLGYEWPLEWKLTDEGLEITPPSLQPCDHAFVFKIEGLE